MDDQKRLKRLPKCLRIQGSSFRCNGSGILPRADIVPVPVRQSPQFTLAQLIDMTRLAVTTVHVNSVSRVQLVKKACKEAKEFIWNKPILPQQNSPASIDMVTSPEEGSSETVKLVFDMRSLYCKGVLVGKQFYELRVSGDQDQTVFVDGSIPLECKETYDKMLGSQNPRVQLQPSDFYNGYECFVKLQPGMPDQRSCFREAARFIGLISLMLLEPSRQKYMMERLCCGPSNPAVFFRMDEIAWDNVHDWGSRSKSAKGIEYEQNETVIEKVYPEERRSAIEMLNIINSTKLLPIKELKHPQKQIFFSRMLLQDNEA